MSLITKFKKLNKDNKGFSLIEILTVVAILSVFVVVLVPAFVGHIGESKLDRDYTKFDSITNAIRTACAEPEVKNEVITKAGGDPLEIVFSISADGKINFENGTMGGQSIANTYMWNNIYQSTGFEYQVASTEHYGKKLIFTIPIKEAYSTWQCSYQIE